jgi:hypothetical protein
VRQIFGPGETGGVAPDFVRLRPDAMVQAARSSMSGTIKTSA